MNITSLKWVYLSLALTCLFSLSVRGEELQQRFTCRQEISTISGVVPVSASTTMAFTLYEAEDDHMTVGPVDTSLVNYVFWKDLYYGTVVAICGADHFTDVLRFFQDSYGPPVTVPRTRTTLWRLETQIIRVKRFSYHLGQVEILCREMFMDLELSEE